VTQISIHADSLRLCRLMCGKANFITALPQGIEKALTKKSRALISKRSEQTFPNQRC
jgi:hypothetical protein